MSQDLYQTRLYWVGQRGVAKLHGCSVPLTAPPMLAGRQPLAVDYTPEVRVARVLCPQAGWREMTAEEIRAADDLLRAQVLPWAQQQQAAQAQQRTAHGGAP
jgi:hypothetical protein